MARQRNHDNNLVRITYSQVVDWAARITRLSHSIEDDQNQQSSLQLAVEMKETANSAVVQVGHTLSVSISEGYIHLEVECHEQERANCRINCPGDCEDSCYEDSCYRFIEKRVPGECVAALWINADSADECYIGDMIPLHDGMRIDVDWSGDNWVWSALAPVTAPS
jgi:hypothetical protein